MSENSNRINQLLERVNALLNRQDGFSKEIDELREEINALKSSQSKEQFEEKKESSTGQTVKEIDTEIKKEAITPTYQSYLRRTEEDYSRYSHPKPDIPTKAKSDIEKFIGENLINKIGIAITIIGVAIGAKYSIEHQLISPLTRILLGYLIGLGLLGVAMQLKKNYKNFSAVLVSGAIAIFYFITYSAYSFYDLVSLGFAFVLMVIFTAFAVVVAIHYNKQVIAHIGLVGAYAVPFLLNEGSGNVHILFSYMAIINLGILLIAVKKYWKPLYYSTFLLSWIIFFSWYIAKYQMNEHFKLALIFLCVFFATLYIIFLAFKLIQKETFDAGDIILLLANSFIFYGIGYSVLSNHPTGEHLLGLFTVCNAILHFGVSMVIYRHKLADRNLFYLVSGLVLVFITIAIPVQLNGNWVTLLWVFEAALIFWIGRTQNAPVYEKLSYPLMFLAFFSIIHDWSSIYNNYNPDQPDTRLIPLWNVNFLNAVLFIASFGFINYLNNDKKYFAPRFVKKEFSSIIAFSIPAILIIVMYNSFRLEILNYWNQLHADYVFAKRNDWSYSDSWNFKTVWVINYSLLFFTFLSYVNIKVIRNRNLGLINIAVNAFFVIVFLYPGLYILSELRESYLIQDISGELHITGFNLWIRYVSFAFAGLMLASIRYYIDQDFIKPVSVNLRIAVDLLFYTSLLWIASSEFLMWTDNSNYSRTHSLGLSILWGMYALLIIALGIWKEKKHLRIGAIGLFGITLIKLFSNDISDLDTIAKTIVFVSLGILLLVISFLYNKYRHLIS